MQQPDARERRAFAAPPTTRTLRLTNLRVLSVLRNLTLASAFTRNHMVDDPVVLVVQASETLPRKIVQPLARATQSLRPSPASRLGALAAAISGDKPDLQRRIAATVARKAPPRVLARLADIALAVHERELAASAFAAIPESMHSLKLVQSVASRIAAYDGDIDGAVTWARRYGATSGVAQRFAGRLDLLNGRQITIETPTAYTPIGNRVLHVLTNSLPHSPSGYPQRTHSILLALREAGWDVIAVTRIAYPVQVGKLMARDLDIIDGIEYHRILPWRVAGDDFKSREQQAEAMSAIVQRFRPAILHTTTPFHNAAPVKAVAEAFGLPWIYEVRGQQADTWVAKHGTASEGSQYHRLFQEREAASAREADAVVTLGDEMRRTLIDSGVDPTTIALCPNAVGQAFLEPPLTKRAARERVGLDPDLTYIGAVSSLVGYEGHDDLLRAFALLQDDFPTLRLLLVGDGVQGPYLHQLARQLQIEGRCLFPGRVPRDQAMLWHQSLDVFAVPRKDLEVTRKVTPLKPVEASASARPVVASRLPALQELVKEDVTGLFCSPDNPQSLAQALRRLLEDPDLADLLGRQGRDWVLSERTWRANAERYGHVYQSLGASPAQGR